MVLTMVQGQEHTQTHTHTHTYSCRQNHTQKRLLHVNTKKTHFCSLCVCMLVVMHTHTHTYKPLEVHHTITFHFIPSITGLSLQFYFPPGFQHSDLIFCSHCSSLCGHSVFPIDFFIYFFSHLGKNS